MENDDIKWGLHPKLIEQYGLVKVDTSDWIKTPFGLMSPELYKEYVEYQQEQADAN